MLSITLLFGAIVGLALGLTGGGGAIFAIPLLVFGLALDPSQAVLVSLMAVGTVALVGFFHRLRLGTVDVFTGAVFAAGGFAGAPLGAIIGGQIPEALLLTLFSALLMLVGARLWLTSRGRRASNTEDDRAENSDNHVPNRTRTAILIGSGVVTGLLSGLFGVGGGFIIVPALVLATRMDMRRASSTSLMIISITSAAAIGSILIRGQAVPWDVTIPFMLGGLLGLVMGTFMNGRISGPRLQQTFSIMMVGVAFFTIAQLLHT
jgi:uncharacterized protein